MDNSYEEILDSYSEVLDSVPDQAAHQEADPVVNADTSSEGASQEVTVSGSSEAEQGSPVNVSPVVQGALDSAAVTYEKDEKEAASSDDLSSAIDYTPYLETIISDNRDILEEMQRIEAHNINILYGLYIGIGIIISYWIIKAINYFVR